MVKRIPDFEKKWFSYSIVWCFISQEHLKTNYGLVLLAADMYTRLEKSRVSFYVRILRNGISQEAYAETCLQNWWF